jgi:hypothetical protein
MLAALVRAACSRRKPASFRRGPAGYFQVILTRSAKRVEQQPHLGPQTRPRGRRTGRATGHGNSPPAQSRTHQRQDPSHCPGRRSPDSLGKSCSGSRTFRAWHDCGNSAPWFPALGGCAGARAHKSYRLRCSVSCQSREDASSPLGPVVRRFPAFRLPTNSASRRPGLGGARQDEDRGRTSPTVGAPPCLFDGVGKGLASLLLLIQKHIPALF